jgi:hypothetical protein
MEENEGSQFDEFNKKIIRRKLLPVWIKIFCWIFMIIGVIAIGCLILGAFRKTADLSLYGFETNQPLTPIGIFIIALMAFKGFTAYTLWFEKASAIKFAKLDAILGVVICVVSMFILPFINNTHFSIRLEIIFLILYYKKINKIEYEWENLEEQ